MLHRGQFFPAFLALMAVSALGIVFVWVAFLSHTRSVVGAYVFLFTDLVEFAALLLLGAAVDEHHRSGHGGDGG